jgi:hypothetical protein
MGTVAPTAVGPEAALSVVVSPASLNGPRNLKDCTPQLVTADMF